MCISIHALREESDKKSYKDKTSGEIFQSTLSVRRATIACTRHWIWIRISIHALREESDIFFFSSSSFCAEFQSTLSVRRATTHIFHILQFA